MRERLGILDVVNTDHAALNFLAHRVGWINQHTEFQNDIICSTGPHLARVKVAGARIKALPIPRGMSPLPLGMLLARTVQHLRRNHYTIVHTHNSITGAIGRMAARIARVPLVIHTTHGFHFHENMSRLQSLPWVEAERRLARMCDVLLCQNREEVGLIHRFGLQPRQGVYHVGNGIDLKQFAPRTGMPSNERPTLLCVGRLEGVKNHPMLFKALAALRGRGPVLLRLVGEGPLDAEYKEQLRREGLADDVEFLGYRYDIPELTAAADVVVLTSLKEGIPRALMQAAAVGVPVVATDVKGTREVVVDGETGFLVPLDDVDALVDRLGALLASETLRREMGAAAVSHARAQFDEDRVAERLARIYRMALRGRSLAQVDEPEVGAEEALEAERLHA
jgi:glycosyltransferase involved in cell wall biosynthesis